MPASDTHYMSVCVCQCVCVLVYMCVGVCASVRETLVARHMCDEIGYIPAFAD